MAESRDVARISYKQPLPVEEAERLGAYAAKHVDLDAQFVRAFRGAQQEAYEVWTQFQAEDDDAAE